MLDLERIAAPSDDVLGLAEAKTHLRVFTADEDNDILAMLATVTGHLDGADGILGRALIHQQWTLYLDRFPGHHRHHDGLERVRRRRYLRHDAIALPLRPLATVDAITWLDGDRVQQTVDPATYQVLDGELSAVQPITGQCWPCALWEARSVAVTFTAGYGDTGASVPMPIVNAMKLMLGDLYENRESQTISETRATQIMNQTAVRLLYNFRPKRL